jgi:hypothetical protein
MTSLEKNEPELYKLMQENEASYLQCVEQAKKHEECARKFMYALRLHLGVSRRDFAEICGVKVNYIYMLESGKRPWTKKLIGKVTAQLPSSFDH